MKNGATTNANVTEGLNRVRTCDQCWPREMGTKGGCTDGSCGKGFHQCLCRVRSSSVAGAPSVRKVLGALRISSTMNQCNRKQQTSATQSCSQCNANTCAVQPKYESDMCKTPSACLIQRRITYENEYSRKLFILSS